MKKLLSLSVALLASSAIHAADLSTIYQQAVANDAEIAAARAMREASGYDVTIARGALLPQASVSYSYSETELKIEGYPKVDYSASALQIQASQTLFNLNSWYNYRAASQGSNAAGLELLMAENQLLIRTAEAYFNVLRAQDNFATAKAEEAAIKRSLEQIEQRYKVGLAAITDVHEAQASYDLTYANLLGQQSALDVSYEILEQLTGQRYETLAQLKDSVIMEAPQPADANLWVESGLEKFPGIHLAEAGKDAARLQRNAARANHAPTIQLVASWSDAEQYQFALSDTIGAKSTNVGIQASLPLFAGGSLYGQSKKAAKTYAASEYQAEHQRRSVRTNVRSLYLQVQTGALNVKARAQAMRSAKSAFEATETGYRVGTRNIVEVLTAQRNVYGAERDYANARYDYIVNLLTLKFYAGTLNEGDLAELNGWLEASAPKASDAAKESAAG